VRRGPQRPTSIGRFALKALIVAIAGIIGVSIATNMVIARIDEMIDRRIDQIHLGGRQFWTRIDRELDRIANSKDVMTPEQEGRLIADLRRLSAKYRPLAIEGWAAITDNPPPEPARATQR
jgi:hypothetical protein